MFQEVTSSPGNQPFSNLTPFLFFVDCADLTWSEQTRFFCWHRRRPLCLQNWCWQEAFSHHTILDSSQPWSTLCKVDLHLYVTARWFPPPQKYWNFVAKLFCGFSFWLLVFGPPGVIRVCHLLVFASAYDLKLCVVQFAWIIFWAWCHLVVLCACLTLSASSSGASRELLQPLLWESPSWGDVNATSNPQIKKRSLRFEMDNCLYIWWDQCTLYENSTYKEYHSSSSARVLG